MSTTPELSNYLAQFYGVVIDPPPEYWRLLAWCAGDGLTHDAPALIATPADEVGAAYAGEPADLAPTPEAANRLAAMVADFEAWIMTDLHRPPGWANDPGYAAVRPEGEPVDDHSTELRDWARAWTAENPS